MQDAVFQVARAEVEHDVEQVEEVGGVVQGEPHGHVVPVNLLEGKPVDDDPKVVEERHTDHAGPPVAQPSGRVEHERPVAAVSIGARGRSAGIRGLRRRPAAVHLASIPDDPVAASDQTFLAEVALDLLPPLTPLVAGGHCGDDVAVARPRLFHQRRLGQGEPLPAGLDLVQSGERDMFFVFF